MNGIDLHCHTTASDGKHDPTDLVRMAADLALDAIAVCDHDSTEGVEEALVAGDALRVEVIPGVELSCDVPGGELHMLGYFPDIADPSFQAELTRLRDGRYGRAQAMVRKLAALGYPISFERVQTLAGEGAIGRPHVAQALLEAGHVQARGEAFERLIGRNGPAYVERAKLTPVDAVRLIRSVGGLPVFAHPYIVTGDGRNLQLVPVEDALPELVEAGLAGIEVYYPRYDTQLIGQLLALAKHHDLLVTGGSDFHGEGVAGAPLGSIYVPRKCLAALKSAHGSSRA